MSDTATQARPQAEIITRDKIMEYLDSFGLLNSLSQQEASQFVEIAQAFNLNPFKREIYCIPYGQGDRRKLSIITGYETYLKRAERLGMLRGWKAWTEGSFKVETKKVTLEGRNGPYTKEKRLPVGDLVAKVSIHREGWDQPFEHEVYLDEYAQDNEMWANKPRTMLKKVAIAQAFRMAFPDEMGGMPYTSDELPPERSEPKPAPEQETRREPAAPPAEAPELDEIKALVKELNLDKDMKERLWNVYQGKLPDILAKLKKMKAERDAPPSQEEKAQAVEVEAKPQEAQENAENDEITVARATVEDFINYIPAPDQGPCRKKLDELKTLDEIDSYRLELVDRYGDLGLF